MITIPMSSVGQDKALVAIPRLENRSIIIIQGKFRNENHDSTTKTHSKPSFARPHTKLPRLNKTVSRCYTRESGEEQPEVRVADQEAATGPSAYSPCRTHRI